MHHRGWKSSDGDTVERQRQQQQGEGGACLVKGKDEQGTVDLCGETGLFFAGR